MAFQLDIPYRGTLQSSKNLADTFGYLSDLARHIPENFPGIARFEPKGPDVFEWTFKEISYQSWTITIRFATRTRCHPQSRIELVPEPADHSSSLSGQWRLQTDGPGTRVDVELTFGIELPAPSFLKPMVAPMATREISKLLERYIHNVENNLST